MLSQLDRKLLNKSCLLTMGQHYTGKVLAQGWPLLIKTTLQIIFLCNFVLELWVNIAQVIFLCNIGTGTSRQYSIGYFLAKRVCALWANISQVIFRRIWTILTRQYFYGMLSQHSQYSIA